MKLIDAGVKIDAISNDIRKIWLEYGDSIIGLQELYVQSGHVLSEITRLVGRDAICKRPAANEII